MLFMNIEYNLDPDFFCFFVRDMSSSSVYVGNDGFGYVHGERRSADGLLL